MGTAAVWRRKSQTRVRTRQVPYDEDAHAAEIQVTGNVRRSHVDILGAAVVATDPLIRGDQR